MKIRVKYGQSIKDAKDTIHTYNAEVEREISDEGMTGEQQVVKMRAAMSYLHNEIHGAVEHQQIKDGLLDPKDAVHAKPAKPAKPEKPAKK